MLQHSILSIYRGFKRHKGSFFINLTGLSVGLASVILIYLWVRDELSVDTFNVNDERLFQVMNNTIAPDGIETIDRTPGPLAQSLAEDVREIETVAVTTGGSRTVGVVTVGDRHLKATGLYVTPNFLNVFSYNLIHGHKDKVLTEKYAVVLSERLALKLFNTTENIVGKTIEWDLGKYNGGKINGIFSISGVFEPPLLNATDQFDILFSYDLYFESDAVDLSSWGGSEPHTYVILKEDTDVDRLNSKIADFMRVKRKALNSNQNLQWVGTIFLQRYSDKYLNGRYENGVPAGGRIAYVQLFSVIALVILAIACINFMNLSTAKAAKKTKEVGIKKVLGAGRRVLVFQYIGESIATTFLALLIAVVIVLLLLPSFNIITGKHLSPVLEAGPVLSILGITLLTGLFSGSYPALHLSHFRPVVVLKGRMSTSVSEAFVRKGLVIFQFSISVVLIISVLVIHNQIGLIQTKNLGYNKDNIIRFPNEGPLREHFEAFIAEARKIPGVINASSMNGDLLGNHGGGSGVEWEGKAPGEEIEFSRVYVDYEMMEMLDMEMAQGRYFLREFGADDTKVIFNETAIVAMGLKDPIGQTVKLWGKDKEIIGVVKDFHFESLYEKIKPFFFECTPGNNNIMAKIRAGTERETIASIGSLYQKYNQGLPFSYSFLDEDFAVMYAAENRVALLSRYFAGIAIVISCLGLFGLTAFTVERRLKEIGIRKVLGDTQVGILFRLTGDLTRMVLVAIVIALPLSYFIIDDWLDDFAYRVYLNPLYFLSGGLAALLIAWLAVGMQTLKASRINPTDCLREE